MIFIYIMTWRWIFTLWRVILIVIYYSMIMTTPVTWNYSSNECVHVEWNDLWLRCAWKLRPDPHIDIRWRMVYNWPHVWQLITFNKIFFIKHSTTKQRAELIVWVRLTSEWRLIYMYVSYLSVRDAVIRAAVINAGSTYQYCTDLCLTLRAPSNIRYGMGARDYDTPTWRCQ